MVYSTRSQGVPVFKSKMAARFRHVSRDHLQKCIVIPSYVTTTELQNIDLFYEKDEVVSSH